MTHGNNKKDFETQDVTVDTLMRQLRETAEIAKKLVSIKTDDLSKRISEKVDLDSLRTKAEEVKESYFKEFNKSKILYGKKEYLYVDLFYVTIENILSAGATSQYKECRILYIVSSDNTLSRYSIVSLVKKDDSGVVDRKLWFSENDWVPLANILISKGEVEKFFKEIDERSDCMVQYQPSFSEIFENEAHVANCITVTYQF